VRDWKTLNQEKEKEKQPKEKKESKAANGNAKIDVMFSKKRKQMALELEKCHLRKCELESTVFVVCDNCRKSFHLSCLKPKPEGSKSKHQVCYDCYDHLKLRKKLKLAEATRETQPMPVCLKCKAAPTITDLCSKCSDEYKLELPRFKDRFVKTQNTMPLKLNKRSQSIIDFKETKKS
jgi:hypothetical protein